MNRRELIKNITLLTGAAFIGTEFLLSGCKNPNSNSVSFSKDILQLLNEVGETIIPTTNTPGAKVANVAEVMKAVVTNCYYPDQQNAFFEGVKSLDAFSEKKYQKKFMKISAQEKHDLLVDLEKEAKEFNQKRDEKDKPLREAHEEKNKKLPMKEQTLFRGAPSHYYSMMKQLTLLGFFSSETGLTQTLRYAWTPGKYDGEVPYVKGESAWA